MATFAPPVVQLPHDETGQDRLWSRVTYPQALTVLLPDPVHGAVTRYPGYQVIESDLLVQAEQTPGTRVFRGGLVYPLSLDELVVLLAAGYGAHIGVPAPPAATSVDLAAEAAAA